ncbi:hypothetical protein [Streptomyces sp. NPDC020362]|uniref:hypothetical protein n=1 Tax=Streptomyces sp. NPDC020362 TaxID=3154486 RepID=UPI00340D1D8A
MDQHASTETHAEAFRFFGGVPRRLVPDNLMTGVDKPDLYDPRIDNSYAELASYYGTLVDPARAAKPKDKPRVEQPMPYVRDSYWSGRTFTSLEHMQAEALLWARNVAGQRQCRPLDGAKPLSVFEAVEAEAPTSSAVRAFRAGQVVEGNGRPGHPHQGRPHPLLGALETDRTPCRRPLHRRHGADLPRGRAGQDSRRPGTGQTHRQERPPAREDRFPDEDADLVPRPGIPGRGRLPSGHRPAPGGQRPLPASRRPGGARAEEEVRGHPAGGRLPQDSTAAEQPRRWTLLDLAAGEADAERLAEQLAACLAPAGGWYVNYSTATEAFVVFADKIFRYPRKQVEGRRQAQDYARSIGIPEPQLDWQD